MVEKVVIFLYSGEMDCDGMVLRFLLYLMEFLNLMNLESKYDIVEAFTEENITEGKYPLTDCLKSLDPCSKMGLQSVGAALMNHLRENLSIICEMKEVAELSSTMASRLIKENEGVQNKSILRLKTLVTWLKVGSRSLPKDRKNESLKMLDLDLENFSHKELASSDVRKSGLYDIDKIMERMDQLFETTARELREVREELTLTDITLQEKENEIETIQELLDDRTDDLRRTEKEIKQLTEDMKTVKINTSCSHWNYVFPTDLTNRYAGL